MRHIHESFHEIDLATPSFRKGSFHSHSLMRKRIVLIGSASTQIGRSEFGHIKPEIRLLDKEFMKVYHDISCLSTSYCRTRAKCDTDSQEKFKKI